MAKTCGGQEQLWSPWGSRLASLEFYFTLDCVTLNHKPYIWSTLWELLTTLTSSFCRQQMEQEFVLLSVGMSLDEF